jgi:cysteinyl-tRNA synthetase
MVKNDEIKLWLRVRNTARQLKQFELADLIRETIEDVYEIKVIDTLTNVTWVDKSWVDK